MFYEYFCVLTFHTSLTHNIKQLKIKKFKWQKF